MAHTVRAACLFLSCLLLCSLGILLGYLLEAHAANPWLSALTFVADLLVSMFVFRELRITRGSPGLPCQMQALSFLLGIAESLFTMAIVGMFAPEAGEVVNVIAFTIILPVWYFPLRSVRGLFLLPMVMTYFIASVPAAGLSVGPSDAMSDFLTALWLSASIGVRYRRDQELLMGCTLALGMVPPMLGGYLHKEKKILLVLWLSLNAAAVYVLVIFARFQRNLPFAVRKCRFIRLDKLRARQESGLGLARMQDLPEDLFGDVKYASEVIIVSHRWLDKYNCDINTPEHPTGFRLQSLLARLDAIYPRSLSQALRHGLSRESLLSMWRSVTTGGADVLIFLDFACLPQEVMRDGKVIPRTLEEQEIFQEALPAMSNLYGTHPVLTCLDVPQDTHPYFASGWCYAEFCTSMVSKSLSRYSQSAIKDYKDWLRETRNGDPKVVEDLERNVLTKDGVQAVVDLFSRDLANKHFSNEADRRVVDTILRAYLTKRLLSDAIQMQDRRAVREHLEQLAIFASAEAVNDPLNDNLDTALHLAVRLPSIEIVQDILDAGGDPNSRNCFGDTPLQFFLFPRLAAGASLCEKRVQPQAETSEECPFLSV